MEQQFEKCSDCNQEMFYGSKIHNQECVGKIKYCDKCGENITCSYNQHNGVCTRRLVTNKPKQCSDCKQDVYVKFAIHNEQCPGKYCDKCGDYFKNATYGQHNGVCTRRLANNKPPVCQYCEEPFSMKISEHKIVCPGKKKTCLWCKGTYYGDNKIHNDQCRLMYKQCRYCQERISTDIKVHSIQCKKTCWYCKQVTDGNFDAHNPICPNRP